MDKYNNPKYPYSKKVKAGKKRTYFVDVKETRNNDYFICITESKRNLHSEDFERHKIHLYKEDLNKFVKALNEAADHLKDLMPDFDFDSFNKDEDID